MGVTFDSIAAQLMGALDEEIQAIKKSGGTDYVGIHDGRYTRMIAGQFIYIFLLDTELNIPSDTPAKLLVDKEQHEAIVVNLQGHEIMIALQNNLGPVIPKAVLSLSAYYLLELLKQRLGEVLKGDLPAERDMAMRLFGFKPCGSIPTEMPATDSGDLNRGQYKALNRCLEQQVTFVWGPPGTGKTCTVGALVRELVRRDDLVLVTSHTNVAVDTALLKVIEAMDDAEIEAGTVVRVGPPARQDPELQRVTLEEVVERKSEGLRRQRAQLEAERNRVLQAREQMASAIQTIETVEESRRQVTAAKKDLVRVEQKLREVEDAIPPARRVLDELSVKLKQAESAGLIRRVFFGLNPETIRRQIAAQEKTISDLESLFKQTEQEKRKARSALAEAQRSYEKACEALERLGPLPTLPELRQQVTEIERNLTALDAELAAIDTRLRQMAATVIREARVVGATLFRLVILEELYRATFDTVIVDEASMVPLPNLWFAATRASKRVVVTGDFRQLPPIATANDEKEYPLAVKWLQTDIFKQAGVVSDRPKLDDNRLCALTEQYRMHEAIGELANVLVYARDGNPLEHKAEPEKYKQATEACPEPGHPLILCTTSGANPWCARLDPGGSRYNIYSAIVCIRLAAEALATGARNVGLVTPYRAQTRLLQYLTEELVVQRSLPAGTIEAATVHRFQGNEKDMIIFDLVDGPPFRIGKLLSGGWASEAMRLLNVACTRAKGKLVVVAHHDYLTKRVADNDSLNILLKHLEKHSRILDSRNVLQNHADPAVDAALSAVFPVQRWLGNPEGATLFNEGTFYPAFLDDLRSASEEAVIFSPFIAERRLADIITALRYLAERGVPVMVVTRERSQSDTATRNLIHKLSQIGIRIITRRELHEKLAFVDRRIAWFGSLNILSHSRSSELMIRFSKPDFVEKLMELTGTIHLIQQQERSDERKQRLAQLATVLEKRMAFPSCPRCGGATELRTGKYGPFFGCISYHKGNCGGLVSIPRRVLELAVQDLALTCPSCKGAVVLRSGRNGVFLACSHYPHCRWTDSF